MKLVTLFSVLALAGLMIVGPKVSLEAKHHRNSFSFSVNPVFAPAYVGGYNPGYVVERYPSYVQEYTYVDSWGMPYREAVYVQPSPRVYYPAYPRPAVSFGFGMMFR